MKRKKRQRGSSRLRLWEAAEHLVEESELALIETSTDLVLTERLLAHYTDELMSAEDPALVSEIASLLRRGHADRGILRTDYERTRRNHRTLHARVAKLRDGSRER